MQHLKVNTKLCLRNCTLEVTLYSIFTHRHQEIRNKGIDSQHISSLAQEGIAKVRSMKLVQYYDK